MTNNPLDAREAALKAFLDFPAEKTGTLYFPAAINAAIDAFIKASSTEDGGEREIRERHEIVDRDQRFTDKIAHHDRATLLSTTAALRSRVGELGQVLRDRNREIDCRIEEKFHLQVGLDGLLVVAQEMLELADNWPGVAYSYDLETRTKSALARALTHASSHTGEG